LGLLKKQLEKLRAVKQFDEKALGRCWKCFGSVEKLLKNCWVLWNSHWKNIWSVEKQLK
jgi:hypothetical protein